MGVGVGVCLPRGMPCPKVVTRCWQDSPCGWLRDCSGLIGGSLGTGLVAQSGQNALIFSSSEEELGTVEPRLP